MKKWVFFILMLSFLISCSIRKNQLEHYLSTLENLRTVISKEDSLKIDSVKQVINKQVEKDKERIEKLEKEGYISFCCAETYQDAYFKTGATGFRMIIFKQFKTNSRSKEGENKLLVTIGKKNNIEKVKFLKTTDEDSKKQIENIFKSKELNQWVSAKKYIFRLETQFEISIFIKKK
ncbi:hypothetical protein [Chryseobacterium limigenitum]|uniref:Lipoprotein n=1 Tax=Chryseobacterium limigenitum TaxID=1612149 RepID=A0A1K2IGB7_9FLAO|nr:hypothetical protein [Chryseobacterium limigenitum]SFZ91322.1 hypothetical protein SAMN05216324_102303 [Chryseobacterium limigenitum]